MKKEFPISLEIYESKKILQAIEDFSEVAVISLEWELLILSWENEEVINEAFCEFMNYVLSL